MTTATKEVVVYTTWCEPVSRGDLKLGPEDVQDAIAEYTATRGKAPDYIILNPKNERYAGEAGDVPVEYRRGLALWEIWLPDAPVSSHPVPNDAPDGEPEPPPQPARTPPAVLTTPTGETIPPPRRKGTPKAKPSKNKGSVAKKNNATGVIMQHHPIHPIAKPKPREGVVKIEDRGKQRGRPLKNGPVCRTTAWRRRKKMQGVLPL